MGCVKGGSVGCVKGGSVGCVKGGSVGCVKGGSVGCVKGGSVGRVKGGSVCAKERGCWVCTISPPPHTPVGSHMSDGLVSAHPLRVHKVASDKHPRPPQPCVTVDGHLAPPQSKVHHLHHIQDTLQRGYTIVQPTIVVEVN